MAEAVTYQCPRCNGQLAFDSASGTLDCAFCGSHFDPVEIERLYAEKQAAADAQAADRVTEEPQVLQPQPDEDPIQTYLKNAQWKGLDGKNLRALNCSSCGAQLMADEVTAVTNCPYCGNATIVPGQLSNILKPDFVIPFKFDRDAALSALKKYYHGKKLLPDTFKDENHLEEIQGIYVPFWLYSGTMHASVSTEGRTVRTWVDKKNSFVATDRYNVYREGDVRFNRVPVDGSTKMPDAHMDSIEPFDYSELKPFSIGYLPGFLADRYDLDVDDCCGRMSQRIETSCARVLLGSVSGYSEVDTVPAASQLRLDEVAYALLPVWMLHTRWHDTDYLFAMNGQTGKIVGDLPIDKGKMLKTFFAWFFPLAFVVALIVYFTLGFGF